MVGFFKKRAENAEPLLKPKGTRIQVRGCSLLNINELVAEEYAKTRKALKTKGRPIPENDIWIAATCLVNNIPLLTFDSDFQHVDDLILIDITHQ